MIHIVRGFDRWGPNDEYPDDPDYECNECGHVFDDDALWAWHDGPGCPKCGSTDVHGGGYYG